MPGVFRWLSNFERDKYGNERKAYCGCAVSLFFNNYHAWILKQHKLQLAEA